jgi:hypothetical protein
MRTTRTLSSVFMLLAFLSCSHLSVSQAPDLCRQTLVNLLNELPAADAGAAAKTAAINTLVEQNLLNPINTFSCFVAANEGASTHNDALRTLAIAKIAPARVSLLDALSNFSAAQQQGSSLSSSGSTNAVTKPSGLTGLAEEFGGINATTGTSSTTFTFSPGTTLTDLAMTGVVPLCYDSKSTGCISPGAIKAWTPFSLKVTANTSNGSQSLTGKSTASGSASSTQVTVNNPTTPTFAFGGLSVQYAIMGSKAKAGATSLTAKPTAADDKVNLQGYVDELVKAHQTWEALKNCPVFYDTWKGQARAALTLATAAGNVSQTDTVDTLEEQMKEQYQSLFSLLATSPDCLKTIEGFTNLEAAILKVRAKNDFGAVQKNSAKPLLAVEYDLNTPQNKPSYSAAKATLNWQFGKGKSPDGNDGKAKTFADDEAKALAAPAPESLANAPKKADAFKTKQVAEIAKPLAKATVQPWSLTATGAADLYNSAPPSTVPSASHLRDLQAGAEIARLFTAPDNASMLRKLLGDVTASAAYSYQDQTSPAILTGPALNDFTGLPSSTTSAYSKRGPIHLGQAKLGFGKGTNMNFPLSFTYSNRSELVVHPTWGVQFGVTYSLTSLFSSSQGTKSGGGN